jgi:hypothetical protein
MVTNRGTKEQGVAGLSGATDNNVPYKWCWFCWSARYTRCCWSNYTRNTRYTQGLSGATGASGSSIPSGLDMQIQYNDNGTWR